MRGLFIHTVVAAVVSALLVGVWLLTGGSTDELSQVQDDPLQAVRDGFWPLIVGAAWAGVLVIHAAAWVGSLLPGGRRQRRRAHHRPALPASPAAPAPGTPPNTDLAKDAARAAIGLVESLAGRAASRPSKPVTATPGRQWVVVMFTDLVESTRLAESLGDATWLELLASHRRLVRQCIHDHDGTEVGTQGDGFLVRFATPDAAVGCAVGVQRQMGDARTGGSFVPELRVGIHAGEAMADDDDLVGRVINLAARVTEAAEPGEI
ncbi:MAG: adenylate/guanylate cyclase domain-containing protein, partial [Acidimicrobiales bacterium]